MNHLIAFIFLLWLTAAHGAVIQPAAGRQPPTGAYTRHTSFTSLGVGVPGGIDQYKEGGSAGWTTVNIDLTGYGETDDIRSVLQAAINANGNGQVRLKIPPGDWTVNDSLITPLGPGNVHRGSFVICGWGQGVTKLRKRSGTNSMVYMGQRSPFGSNGFEGGGGVVLGSPLSQGATSVTLSDATNFPVNTMIAFYWADLTDNTTIATGVAPMFHTSNSSGGFTRYQFSFITQKSGSTLTFYPPIISNPHSSLTTWALPSNLNQDTTNIGFEDLTFVADPSLTNGSITTLVDLSEVRNSWLFNVEIDAGEEARYALQVGASTRVEVRGCYLHGVNAGAPSYAVVLWANNVSCLVEDNIITRGSPHLEVNAGFGNVFAHNYVPGEFNVNHYPASYGNLYIRNYVGYFKDDAYFGPSHTNSYIGNAGYQFGGLVLRRFAFQSHAYGNVWGSTSDGNTSSWINGFGIPYIGGSDPYIGVKTHSEILAGVFPADWPYPPQTITLLTRENDTYGIWEANGSAFFWDGGIHNQLLLSGGIELDGNMEASYGLATVITEKRIRKRRLNSVTLPDEGTTYNLIAPGPDGYGEHNDDSWNSMDFRGNFMIGSFTSFPTQSIGADTIWEPLGDTTKPNGNGRDAIAWGDCPWYDNGGVQYGFINRSAPADVGPRDLPAGRAFIDGNLTRYNPASSPSAPSYSAGKLRILRR